MSVADLNELRWIVNGFLVRHEGAPCPEGLIERARAAVATQDAIPDDASPAVRKAMERFYAKLGDCCAGPGEKR